MLVGFHEAGQTHANESIERVSRVLHPFAQCAGDIGLLAFGDQALSGDEDVKVKESGGS